MIKRLVGSLGMLLFAGCAANDGRPDFARMSDEELALYNASVPFQEQVICRSDPQTGSHLRRRICMTREEDYQAKRNDMEILRTVNSGPVGIDLR